MKLIYTHPSIIAVTQVKNTLEAAGLECCLCNEYAAGAIGELAPIDAWPELWLTRDRDWQQASRLLEQSDREADGLDWQCVDCGRQSPASFELCWHCAASRPDQPIAD